ncbi:MAG: AMP-binding protein [Myxococcota bacterium]
MLSKESDAPVDERDREARRAGDLLFLIYTSGTTPEGGPPQPRPRRAHRPRRAYHSQRLRPDDRTYCCLPLYHTAGGIMATGAILLAGGTLVIARRFSASRFASDCVRHQITTFQYIGELCRYLLQSPRQPDEARLRIRVAIGNGLRPEVWQPFQERFGIGRIVEFYGATEGNVPLVNVAGKPGAVGQLPFFMRRPMGIELLRFDIDSEEPVRGKDGFCERCAVGEPGELVGRITALAAFEGYTNEEATRKKILRDVFEAGDAYFRTGDLLRCDEEGFFYFVDRIGDTFRWKGENVSTAEVAVVLGSETGVAEANVYGVAVPGVEGRAGMAAIVAGEDFSLPSLQERIDRELAAWARPLFLRLLPSMEITGTFKHRKIDLVREAFDPAQVPDPLYVRDPDSGTYVPLDAERYAGITSGALRL